MARVIVVNLNTGDRGVVRCQLIFQNQLGPLALFHGCRNHLVRLLGIRRFLVIVLILAVLPVPVARVGFRDPHLHIGLFVGRGGDSAVIAVLGLQNVRYIGADHPCRDSHFVAGRNRALIKEVGQHDGRIGRSVAGAGPGGYLAVVRTPRIPERPVTGLLAAQLKHLAAVGKIRRPGIRQL